MGADIAPVGILAGLICIPLPIYAKVNMDADIASVVALAGIF